MNESIEAGYIVEKPSLALRFWRWLGYRTRQPEIDTDMEGPTMPGWIMTDITVRLSFGDRIRLLISGAASIRVETRTSAEVDAKSWSSFSVLPPGRR